MANVDSQDFSRVVAEAEAAVSSVKDPELKRVAFDKILDRLLAGPELPPTQGKHRSSRSIKKKPSNPISAARGPQGYIQQLADEGFFGKPQTISSIKVELANRGHHFGLTQLSTPLQRLCQKRVLRRHKGSVPGAIGTFHYSNW